MPPAYETAPRPSGVEERSDRLETSGLDLAEKQIIAGSRTAAERLTAAGQPVTRKA